MGRGRDPGPGPDCQRRAAAGMVDIAGLWTTKAGFQITTFRLSASATNILAIIFAIMKSVHPKWRYPQYSYFLYLNLLKQCRAFKVLLIIFTDLYLDTRKLHCPWVTYWKRVLFSRLNKMKRLLLTNSKDFLLKFQYFAYSTQNHTTLKCTPTPFVTETNAVICMLFICLIWLFNSM